MKTLGIYGAGGHGRVLADMAESLGWGEVLFFDDAVPAGNTVSGWSVAGRFTELVAKAPRLDGVVIGIGKNNVRALFQQRLADAGISAQTMVSPQAAVSRRAVLGPGSVVMAGAVIQAFAKLGQGCIVNTSASIDHDCLLEDFVHVSPGARLAGGVRVGTGAWIGIGASIRENLVIGARTVIGAGAAVVDDIPDDSLAIGVPARCSPLHRAE